MNGDILLKDISSFNPGSQSVQRSKTIYALLVEGTASYISLKLFRTSTGCQAGGRLKNFVVLALSTILLGIAGPFMHIW